jgi:hypothetical protein
MSEMIGEDLGGGRVVNWKGVGSEESVPLSEKMTNLLFWSFLVLDLCWKGLHNHVWDRMEQEFLDGLFKHFG